MNVAAIVVCEMIEDETRLAIERALPEADHPPLVWIESQLHERPTKLLARLQELIDQLDAGAREGKCVTVRGVRPGDGPAEDRLEEVEVQPTGDIVLGFGYCGGGLEGIVSRERRLVFLRAHYCVDVMLRAGPETDTTKRDSRSYYVTKGWFCHSGSSSGNVDIWHTRHPSEEVKRLLRLMLVNYDYLALIDTGAFDIDEWLPHSIARANEWELEHRVVPGSVDALERLFAGTGGEGDTIVLEPGQPMRLGYLFSAAE